MEQTLKDRSNVDGPAEFYLRKIARLETDGAKAWDGIVEL